jgi:hypothetical protein
VGEEVIVVATPTRDTVTAGFCGDLVKLCRRHPDLKFAAVTGIYIANLRNMAVNLARQVGASHVLFIDSDMRFPEDTVDRLLAADKDIVASNCIMRTMPEWWVARKNGAMVSSYGKSGLEDVDTVGCGVMLIKLSVFDRLPSPWFSTPFNGSDHTGEDVYFCQQARIAGFDIWIDHDLSQDVRHTGTVELGVLTTK